MTTTDFSLAVYQKLYLARRAEELIVKHYPEDEMKTPMHMSMGQEAVSVGVCQALNPEDQVFGFYRSHALFLAKTGDPDGFFAELYGKVTGVAEGKAGSMHLAAPDHGHMLSSAIVSSAIPVAVGAAFANKQLRTGRVSCGFFGDGALEEGVFWESLNAACVMKLPMIFVCEDNGWAIHSSPKVRYGFKNIDDIVRQFDCNVFTDATGDAESIASVTRAAIEAIHATQKPAFMHVRCYRYLDHIGIVDDFNVGYRGREEYEEWLKRDSLVIQRRRLLDAGFTEDDVIREERAIDERLEVALQKAREALFPAPQDLYKGVFYEAH